MCPPPLTFQYTKNPAEGESLGYMYIAAPAPFGNCTLPCQSMFYEESQWDKYNILTKGMGTVSFVLSCLVLLTYGPINRNFFKMNRHTTIVYLISLSTALIGIADLLYTSYGDSVICPEPNRYARQTDDKCLAQGILYQFGWLGAVIFWAFLSIDGYLRVTGKQTSSKIMYGVLGALFAVIIALTFGPIAGDQYGYYPVGVNSCWILEKNWQYGFFWWVVIVSLAVGFVGICLTVFSMIKKTSDGKNFKHAMQLVMVILFFFEILYMICFFGVINDRKDQYTATISQRVQCLLKAAMTHLTEKDPIQYCPFEHTIGFASQYTFSFFVKVLGIQIFVFLGLSKESLLLWKSSTLFTALGLGDKDAYEVEMDEN
ncbi:hypothetical protein DICPUDRAFT_74651 [Dictyostelium purpureum]|uniref:G-protein coupled receptors family 2 profile 2 domain-containing protein n=1 Tax=Dictyostelium purpureum TaxID=5786 RepID=F0Z8D2_DICPU|nr:uncharacterized protein DICPUDRAFT_74651 [Dictyostelium purpureum]EGC39819.1 hypothetical protein DICPUDRAFT_74651 [Dictyostelium purpureum]|eukprot:XP_003283686.1 hypothetical protein DICPUDRAFT_74651 [Dictyostelium purpureum]